MGSNKTVFPRMFVCVRHGVRVNLAVVTLCLVFFDDFYLEFVACVCLEKAVFYDKKGYHIQS